MTNQIFSNLKKQLKKAKRSANKYWRIVREMAGFPVQNTFNRRYLDKFNELNCVPDITQKAKFNARHICNIMAAWMMFKRVFKKLDGVEGRDIQTQVRNDKFVVYTSNRRMALFLRYLTKWDVRTSVVLGGEAFLNIPNNLPFFYFGINPSVRELRELRATFDDGKSKYEMMSGIVVGSDPEFLDRTIGLNVIEPYYDECILGQNKLVSLV